MFLVDQTGTFDWNETRHPNSTKLKTSNKAIL